MDVTLSSTPCTSRGAPHDVGIKRVIIDRPLLGQIETIERCRLAVGAWEPAEIDRPVGRIGVTRR